MITQSIDFAQLALYAFWIFFAGLIYWLRKEDRREGYPLEKDFPRRVGSTTNVLLPKPKTFLLPEGGEYQAPNFARDTRDFEIARTAPATGSTSTPTTRNPLLAGVGPSSYAERHDEPELTREGRIAIVPMRVATDYRVTAGHDVRGWNLVGADGQVCGKVKDIWVDRAEMIVRYLEVGLGENGDDVRLVPINTVVVRGDKSYVETEALRSTQLALAPTLKQTEQITLMEEERIVAFFAGARMYAEPKRMGPVV
ncbi:MAG: photosynthetic reaction center subunit H [Myxococcota bacterium]